MSKMFLNALNVGVKIGFDVNILFITINNSACKYGQVRSKFVIKDVRS